MCVAHVSILDLLVFTRHDHFTSKKGGGVYFFRKFFYDPLFNDENIVDGKMSKKYSECRLWPYLIYG